MFRRLRVIRSLMRLQTPAGRANPYPLYQAIQDRAPVLRFQGQWSLSKHRHASLIKDPRFIIGVDPASFDREPTSWERSAQDFLLFLDPPDHTRVRSLVTSAFTPRAIESWRRRIEEIVQDLLERLRHEGSFDLIADFAYPLPVRVICEVLGLPTELGDDFRRWSRAMAPAFGDQTPAVMTEANEAVANMREALMAVVSSRRQALGNDLLSSLITATDDGRTLSSDELLANLILLFFGGHETTVNLIGNGMLAFMRNRDQWELLKSEPELARGAVEEALRFDSPVQATSRTVAGDIEIEGHRLKTGDKVNFIFGAANRDPDVFATPHAFDITRPNAARHLAFGGGGHYCVGAPLARLEGEVAFAALARTLPNLRVAAEPEWREMFILRGMKALAVTA